MVCCHCWYVQCRWLRGYLSGVQPIMSTVMVLYILALLRTDYELLYKPVFLVLYTLWITQHMSILAQHMRLTDRAAPPASAHRAGARAYLLAMVSKSLAAVGMLPIPERIVKEGLSLQTFVCLHLVEAIADQVRAHGHCSSTSLVP